MLIENERGCGRQITGQIRQRIARYHQSIALDRLLHFGGVVPETTRVLTEAAIMGKRDELRGLKENVIVGRFDSGRYRFGLPPCAREQTRVRTEPCGRRVVPRGA